MAQGMVSKGPLQMMRGKVGRGVGGGGGEPASRKVQPGARLAATSNTFGGAYSSGRARAGPAGGWGVNQLGRTNEVDQLVSHSLELSATQPLPMASISKGGGGGGGRVGSGGSGGKENGRGGVKTTGAPGLPSWPRTSAPGHLGSTSKVRRAPVRLTHTRN